MRSKFFYLNLELSWFLNIRYVLHYLNGQLVEPRAFATTAVLFTIVVLLVISGKYHN